MTLLSRWGAAAGMVMALAAAGCSAPAVTHEPKAVGAVVATTQAADKPFIHARAIIIVRHGDIDISNKKTMGGDAPLTAAGEARAKALAYALKDAGINRIIVTDTLRTHQTAAVLSQELGLTAENPFGHGGPKGVMLPDAQYAASKKQEAVNVVRYLAQTSKPEDVVLLVHHHSVIPGILKNLGYTEEAAFEEGTEFDRVYVVLPDEKTGDYHVMRLRYGGAWAGKGQ